MDLILSALMSQSFCNRCMPSYMPSYIYRTIRFKFGPWGSKWHKIRTCIQLFYILLFIRDIKGKSPICHDISMPLELGGGGGGLPYIEMRYVPFFEGTFSAGK